MRSHKIATNAKKRGSALLIAICVVFIFGLTVGYVLVATSNQTRNIYRTEFMSKALAGSAASLNAATQQISYLANKRPAQIQSISDIDATIKTLDVPAVGPVVFAKASNGKDLGFITAAAGAQNDGTYRTISEKKDKWYGYLTARWSYDTVAFAMPAGEDGSEDVAADRIGFNGAGFHKQINIDYIPLYQFAIFYDGDLELHNGPSLDVKGPVHTNGNLWIGAGNGSETDFRSRVSAVGLYRAYNDFTNLHINAVSTDPGYRWPLETYDRNGDIKIMDALSQKLVNAWNVSSAIDTNGNHQLDGLDKNWMADATTMWHGNFEDKSMGVNPIHPPMPDDASPIDMIARASSSDNASKADMRFENKADIKIVGNPPSPDDLLLNHSDSRYKAAISAIKVYKASGYNNGKPTGWVEVPNCGPDQTGTNKVWDVGEFYDGQQMTYVRTIDIDMGNLNTKFGTQFQNQGLLYASTTPGQTDGSHNDTFTAPPTDFTTSGRSNYLAGVRIFDAASLPSNSNGGFTVATDRPLYTVGNLNVSDSVVSLLAADSITVLSQKLTVAQTFDSNKSEPAKNPYSSTNLPIKKTAAVNNSPKSGLSGTLTNSIFLMGQAPSTFSAQGKRVTQSGGAHNVLRYLENWGSLKHEFNGSLICLFSSKIATWNWRNDTGHNYYDAPGRNYFWDSTLQTRTPPPGMPVLIDLSSQQLVRISKSEAENILAGKS